MKKGEGISKLIQKILMNRGLKTTNEMYDFLNPDYEKMKNDPFLLSGMNRAVERIVLARKNNEKVTIYGDYDIDGMTATIILWESLRQFGLDVETYTPDRFTEGYGLNLKAIEKIANDGTKLIITVDNGTLSFDEIARAKELGVDVIITDHHTPHAELPDAVAILNPKTLLIQNPEIYDENLVKKKLSRKKIYPFADLAGCGVAFKLVQALQTVFDEIPNGQEKWLLDLVALGTVCDIVGLVDENRANVKWGLEVLKKTRRPGLKAILAIAGIDPENIDVRTLGFVIGPRLNSAGRMATAEIALELLKTDDNMRALELAQKLEDLNKKRRKVQDKIFTEAIAQISKKDKVAIAVGDDWHEGVIGIVASKILEKFEKPAFVMSRGEKISKASGRSFGQFSIVKTIHATKDFLIKGGGHPAAGGLTIESSRIDDWRRAVQEFYLSQGLKNQKEFLYPKPDVIVDNFSEFTPELFDEIIKLEPFGASNSAPVFEISNALILSRHTMGANNEHVKYVFADQDERKFTAVAFGAAEKFTLTELDENDEPQHIKILVELIKNEWNGQINIEGRLMRLDKIN